MDELPPKAAALLELARRQHDPSRGDSERVRVALYAALAVPAPPATPEPGADLLAAGKTGVGWFSSLAGKTVLIATLVGGATLAGWLALSPQVQVHTGQSASVAAAARAALPATGATRVLSARDGLSSLAGGTARSDSNVVSAAPAQASAQAALLEGPDPLQAAAPQAARSGRGIRERAARRARRDPAPPALSVLEAVAPFTGVAAVVAAAPSAVAPVAAAAVAASEIPAPAAPAAPATSDELALMRATLTSLNAGAVQHALQLLSIHAQRYPQGVMAQERAGLRALALCTLGDLEAGRREQQRFLAFGATSSLARRVRAACTEPAP